LYSFVLVYPAYRRIISGIPQDNSGRSWAISILIDKLYSFIELWGKISVFLL
jgi:hypothetical protein